MEFKDERLYDTEQEQGETSRRQDKTYGQCQESTLKAAKENVTGKVSDQGGKELRREGHGEQSLSSAPGVKFISYTSPPSRK